MTFKNAKENYQVNVRPVLTGKDLKKAEINFENAIDTFKKEKNSLDNIEKELGFYKEENNIFNLSLEGSKTFEEIIEIEKELIVAACEEKEHGYAIITVDDFIIPPT